MSKLDIKCLDEGYSFVDICGLPLYRGSGLKYCDYSAVAYGESVFLCIEEVDWNG